MGSNNICTILLLFILGYIIYILTKPTTNDILNDNINNKINYEHFTSDGKINDPLLNSIAENIITTTAPNITSTVIPTANSTINTINIDSKQSDLFNFQHYDDNSFNYGSNDNSEQTAPNNHPELQFGAELNSAYTNQFPNDNNNHTAPPIDLNKGNVTNYNSKDYLPKETNPTWFDTDFSQAQINITDDQLINTNKYVIGVNTVGQSLKNASYDIRGTVANPKFTISPWNNSTYEPDYNLKPLC